jgi:uncharacterized membrane protein YphA (DoxX/SURF4 family)
MAFDILWLSQSQRFPRLFIDDKRNWKSMATITSNYVHERGTAPAALDKATRVAIILRWTYGLVPIAAGVDKFFHFLTDWTQYLAPVVINVIPVSPNTFMNIVGAIEIFAGILVLVRPRLGSFIVGCWLLGIAANLVMTGQYYDIAVRDIVMAIGAFCLFILSNGNGRRDEISL